MAEAVRVPFSGYAEDCTISGELLLEADRLTDFLSATATLQVDGVVCRSLDDGHVVETPTTELLRDELCLVVATGPRGRPELRRWTRQHAVRAEVGPYVVQGFVHAAPTLDPIRSNERRPVIALTSCVVDYVADGRAVRESVPVALLVGSRVAVMTQISTLPREATSEDVVEAPGGPLAEPGTAPA